jgi:glycyl-tRNA synthetase beta chain
LALSEQQEDIRQEIKGPAKKIAIDQEGNWTKAALGFAGSQKAQVDTLFFKEIKGVDYVFAIKEIKGEATVKLLPQIKDIVKGLTFPKSMRWSHYDLSFVRPIQWLIALYGNEIIPFEITGVQSSNVSYGHRFLGEKIEISHPQEYVQLLNEAYVIASVEERGQLIREQLKVLEQQNNWIIPIDQGLFEEVIQLVEYPTALVGSFDQSFLEIPEEVLITSMKEHQRYFPVKCQEGKLLPYFVTIRNGLEDEKGIVSRGNEKVLRARLSDARFFYEEDKRLQIGDALQRLEQVVFHEELGSIADKIRRVRVLSSEFGNMLQLPEEQRHMIARAAELCKFDLVSHMVYEFPELQGRMGEEYAMLAGETSTVSKAIFEHYLPRFAGDILPQTLAGAILGVADKLDTIVGCFGIGIIPTGSQDPYALRRQAAGIIQIILDQKWRIDLASLIKISLQVLHQRELLKKPEQELLADILSFFEQRMKTKMQDQSIRYDVMDAVLSTEETDVEALFTKAEVLNHRLTPEAKTLLESFVRVQNLAQKQEGDMIEVEQELFESRGEQQLFLKYIEIEKGFRESIQHRNWEQAFDFLASFEQPIVHYFEEVMVMTDDLSKRQNRLALLKRLSDLMNEYAVFSKITI